MEDDEADYQGQEGQAADEVGNKKGSKDHYDMIGRVLFSMSVVDEACCGIGRFWRK